MIQQMMTAQGNKPEFSDFATTPAANPWKVADPWKVTVAVVEEEVDEVIISSIPTTTIQLTSSSSITTTSASSTNHPATSLLPLDRSGQA